MLNHSNKIKLYVLGSVVVILLFSRLVYWGVHQNSKFTPGFFAGLFRSIQAEQEFNRFLSEDNNISPNTSYAQEQEGVTLEYENSIPVLVYHGIPYDDFPNQFNITTESFKEHMFALKKAGYNTITTQELYKYLRNEIELPEKSILVTFDDGRIDSFTLADPVLKALDYKATMFTIGRYSFLGEREQYYLSLDKLKEMDESGRWDIQAHSYDGHESYFIAPGIQEGHFFSHKQWVDSKNSLETDTEFTQRIVNDFKQVKSDLENLLGKPIESFAFPYGDFGQNNTNFKGAKDINTEEGMKLFSMMFYQTSPSQRFTNNYRIDKKSNDEFFLIKRIVANPEWKGVELLDHLNKSTAKTLPYTDNFTQDNGWLSLWGKLSVKGGTLDLRAQNGETGGTTLLDGTRLWKDYSILASVISPNQTAVYVWARFQDDENNVACDFSNGFIHIEQTIDGNKTVVRGVIDESIQIPDTEFEIEVRVKDREIQCILNNEFVLESTFIDPKLDAGGIGFKTWNKDADIANVIVKKLTVQEYETN